MHVLLLDEFGHEDAFDKRQCPVFGYGGVLIPGQQLSSFCTQFFDLKIVAFRNVFKNRVKSRLEGRDSDASKAKFLVRKPEETLRRILNKMNNLKNDELIKDREIRRLVAQYEVMGFDVFSSSYVTKLNDRISQGRASAKRKKSRFFRFAKLFLDVVAQNQGQIFYYGFHRTKYPTLGPHDRIHVELVRDVITQANEFACDKNTTVKVIFDHHHTDEIKYLRDKDGSFITDKNGHKRREKTREDRAAEIILNGGYYDNITDPIFQAKSHLSQGVQAADWMCTLLKNLWIHRTEQTSPDFHDALDQRVFENVCQTAMFKSKVGNFKGKLYPIQTAFPFLDPPPRGSPSTRPYRRQND